jgi:ABC-2 type transport system ATP-binding protein
MPHLNVQERRVLDPSIPAIEVTDLTQRFGAVRAVDGLSLSIPPGMFYGIVGPNGAGKTTFLMAICGLREPTSGTIRIAGHDLRTDREIDDTALSQIMADVAVARPA